MTVSPIALRSTRWGSAAQGQERRHVLRILVDVLRDVVGLILVLVLRSS